MSTVARVGTLCWVLAGCGDEVVVPAPLAEVCGEVGPFRLLALEAGQRPVPEDSIVRVGDRVVLLVGTGERPGYSPRGPLLASTTAHAVGVCGEDPREIGRDVDRVFTVPQWPGVVLGCEIETRALLRLDPTGVAKSQRLAAACDATWTPAGLVHVEYGDPTRVLFQAYVTPSQLGFAAPVVLLDKLPETTANSYVRPRPLIDGALALLADGDLVHVDLAGNLRVEQPGVRYFALSADDRFLLWQDLASGDPEAERPEGNIFVRDRSSGTGASVIHGHLPPRNSNPLFPEPDAAQITLGETLAGQWLVSLPSFALYRIPPGRQLSRRAADGRWLVRSALFGPFLLRDLESGAEVPVADQKGYLFGPFIDHLELLPSTSVLYYRDERPLARYPFDGGEPEQLAARATRGYFLLADGRVVSPLSINGRWLGALVIIDPVTLEELRIDDHVAAGVDLAAWQRVFAADEVAYVVDDGARSGVWLARLR